VARTESLDPKVRHLAESLKKDEETASVRKAKDRRQHLSLCREYKWQFTGKVPHPLVYLRFIWLWPGTYWDE
jgi:hypothetical protein